MLLRTTLARLSRLTSFRGIVFVAETATEAHKFSALAI